MDDKVLENIAARLRNALLNDGGDRWTLRMEILEIAREIESRVKQDKALRGEK